MQHVTGALHLRKAVDYVALQKAFQLLLRRHEALRTGIHAQDGVPIQTVHDQVVFELPFYELPTDAVSSHDRANLINLARDMIRKDSLRPFDLSCPPLLRAQLIRVGADEYFLGLVFHHIIVDGWSFDIIERELKELYEALIENRSPRLVERIVDYGDVAVWQAHWLESDSVKSQIDYWCSSLEGGKFDLKLPTDISSHSGLTGRVKVLTHVFDQRRREQIALTAQSAGASVFMHMAAIAYGVVMHMTRQNDVCLGIPVANRNRHEFEHIVGLFANTLVLRVSVAPASTFSDLVQTLKKVVLGAFDHQDAPFDRVVSAVRKNATHKIEALFDLMLAFRNGSEQLDSKSTAVGMHNDTPQFPMTFDFVDTGKSIIFNLEYDDSLFSEQQCRKVLQCFEQLSDLTDGSVTETLSEIFKTLPTFTKELRVHHLFERQAESNPQSIALKSEDILLTYRELNQQAERVAQNLLRRNLNSCSLVALQFSNRLSLIATILGVWKAGYAYLPLDIDCPFDRVSYILQDSGATVIITDSLAEGYDVALESLPILSFSDLDLLVTTPVSVLPERDESSLAYVIYTSGSTGKPKGVSIAHRNLVNLCSAIEQRYDLKVSDTVLQFSNPSFDVFAEEVFPTLSVGATLSVSSVGLKLEGERLMDFVTRHAITVLNLPTAYWHGLVHTLEDLPWPKVVRCLIVGGEQASTPLYNRWRQANPSIRWINAYGPTETTVTATCFEPKGLLDPSVLMPIGFALNNVSVQVLDDDCLPVMPGCTGRLFIGGAGVGLGYVGRDDLTRQRFIKNPSSLLDDDIVYDTGDQVLIRSEDGALVFLGRKDEQVKIRGHRIEIHEIEQVLLSHSPISAVCVLVNSDIDGAQSIVAHYVSHTSDSVSAQQLRVFVSRYLPAFMMPNVFIEHQEFMLTERGKIDKDALRLFNVSTKPDSVAPANEVETRIAEIWNSLLGVTNVSATISFYEAGGHSLLSLRLLSKLNGVFKTSLTLGDVLEADTIQKLGVLVSLNTDSEGEHVAPELVKLNDQGQQNSLLLVPGVQGQASCYRLLANELNHKQSVTSFQTLESNEASLAQVTVEDIAQKFLTAAQVNLRKAVTLGGWSMGGAVAFEMGLQMERAGRPISKLILIDAFLADDLSFDQSALLAPVDSAQVLLHYLRMTHGFAFNTDPAQSNGHVQNLSVALILEQARAANIPDAFIPYSDLLSLIQISRANEIALMRYQPRQRYAGEVVYIQAAETAQHVGASKIIRSWQNWCTKEIVVHTCPGSHLELLEYPQVTDLAQIVQLQSVY